MNHFTKRLTDVKGQLGYMNYTVPNWVQQSRAMVNSATSTEGLPFLARRHLAHLIFQGEFDWRVPMYGGVWAHSNIHLPIARRIVEQQSARINNYFYGTQPFFNCSPVGTADNDFATMLNRWARSEAQRNHISDVLREANQLAFIQGEQIIKPVWQQEVQFYEAYLTVGFDPRTGEPFTAQDGDYIYEKDTWIEGIVDPLLGIVGLVLARDGQTPKPPVDLVMKRELLPRKVTQFEGARLINIDFQSFLTPLTAPDLHHADVQFHLYSETLVNLVARFASIDTGTGVSPKDMLERIGRFVHEFHGGAGDDWRPDQRPRPELAENTGMLGADQSEPTITIAETHGFYDALHNGNPARVVVLFDDASGKPIFYDYEGTISQWNKGLPPFIANRINPVPGRWHGRGNVELIYKVEHTMDLLVNRWNFAQMKAGRVDVVNRNAFWELANDPTIPINGGTTLSIKDGIDPKTALFSYYFNEIKGADIQQLLQLLMQVVTNGSGVANANDASAAGLNTSDLATGVHNIEASGNELCSAWIAQLSPAHQDAIVAFIKLTASTLNTPRAYTYFEGETRKLGEVLPEHVANLELDVDMELAGYKAQQSVRDNEQYSRAYEALQSYYTTLIPQVQERLAVFMRGWLKKAFGMNDADTIVGPLGIPLTAGIDPATGQPVPLQPQLPNTPPPADNANAPTTGANDASASLPL